MLTWLKSRLQMPVPAGPSAVLRRLESATTPVSQDGVCADGDGWRIVSTAARSVRLFEVPVTGVENCMLTYRLVLRTEAARGIYLQLWCRLPGRGEFFSKGLHDKVRGTTDWGVHEVPFLLRRGQAPDLLKLDLVFEGAGTSWVRDVEILRTPLR